MAMPKSKSNRPNGVRNFRSESLREKHEGKEEKETRISHQNQFEFPSQTNSSEKKVESPFKGGGHRDPQELRESLERARQMLRSRSGIGILNILSFRLQRKQQELGRRNNPGLKIAETHHKKTGG